MALSQKRGPSKFGGAPFASLQFHPKKGTLRKGTSIELFATNERVLSFGALNGFFQPASACVTGIESCLVARSAGVSRQLRKETTSRFYLEPQIVVLAKAGN